MKLPELKIGDKIAKMPIIQGGMAIRLSTAKLAAAVANSGGIGLIAASGMSLNELNDFCLKHKEKYYEFYVMNKFQIENGNYPNMVPWWN